MQNTALLIMCHSCPVAPDQGEEKKQALNKEKRARKLLKILGMVYGSIRNRFADNFGEKTYEHVR